jgi:hypothetical protein
MWEKRAGRLKATGHEASSFLLFIASSQLVQDGVRLRDEKRGVTFDKRS